MSAEASLWPGGAGHAAAVRTGESPFVSVIVPVWNDIERLKACLSGLTAQTYPQDRFEVIVVDNGSHDPVAERLPERPRMRVIREERPGSYAARNAGIRCARGEVLAFTDADCVPTPRWLETGVTALMSVPHCGLVGGRVEVFPRDPASLTATEAYELAVGFPQQRYVGRGKYGATANMFTTRAMMKLVGPFDENLFSSGDRIWGKAVFHAGYRIEYSADAVVRHPARRSLDEMRRKMRRVAFGNYALARRGWIAHMARMGVPIGPRSLLLRLVAPPVQHLVDIWTNGILIRRGERLRASLVAIYTKYVWTAYRVYFAVGGATHEERVRGDLPTNGSGTSRAAR